MDNKTKNKFSKILTNIDDKEFKKYNNFNSTLENEKDILQSPDKDIFKYNNSSSQNNFSIMDKTNELIYLNSDISDINKKNEERKNIDMDIVNFNNSKENFSLHHNYLNINYNNNDNDNGTNNNKLMYNNYRSKLKDILSQNKKIINSIIKNDINDDTLKIDLNYSNNFNNKYTNLYLTNQNSINKNNEKNKDKFIEDYNNKNERKTFFNYNDDFQKQIEEKDDYLKNIQKFNQNSKSQL